MNSPNDRAQSIVERVRNCPVSDRAVFLNGACGEDVALRAEVERLLAREEQTLATAADPTRERVPAPIVSPPALGDEIVITEEAGSTIGRYRLLEKIGEGGFGAVWAAEQKEPVKRRVALKIIKLGMDTKQVVARFEAERQALALMDHPHIAKVLDGGATETGRPYFVMDLVRGIPITEYCDKQKLTTKERLELFMPVCQAIQHAHQKGIIHRDLKPSNVMVTLSDGVAHPIVIDFGVAKATNQKLTEQTLFTNFGQMIGTPAYMAPEQAEMSRLDVDTRSDIYSLGVLLYELLTGTQPFPEEELRSSGWAEVQRIIAEKEPPTPSRRLSTLTAEQRTELENRHQESPNHISGTLRGDLDWIVMKCLEKDRNRRYETANGLARDLQRHLANEPITARPPSRLYELQKTVRRHKVGFAAAVAILLVILLGACVSAWQAIRAKHAQADAEQQAATAQATLGFIQDDLFGRVRLQPNLTLFDALQVTTEQIGDRYQDKPLVEAALRLTVGKAYVGKGFRAQGTPRNAEQHLARAVELYSNTLGPTDEKTLEAKLELAWLFVHLARYHEAESLSQEVLALRKARFGPDHEETLKALLCVGYLYDFSARHEEAGLTLQRVLTAALEAETPNYQIVHDAWRGLAWVAVSTRGREELSRCRRHAFEVAREHFGPNDPQTLMDACFWTQDLRLYANRFEDSLRLAGDTYERCLQFLGEDHWTTLWCRMEIAELNHLKGFQITAELRNVLDRAADVLGDEHWNTLFTQWQLGAHQVNDGYLADGTANLADAWKRNQRVEGSDTYLSRQLGRALANGYPRQGRFAEAEDLHRRILASGRRVLPVEAPWLKEQTCLLGDLLARLAKRTEAAQVFDSAATGPAQDETAVAPGLLAAAAPHYRRSLNGLGNLTEQRLSSTQDAGDAFDLARGLLLVLDQLPSADNTQVVRLSERAADLQTDPVKQAVLLALTAWRKEDWAAAQKAAGALTIQADGRVASLGGFVLAIATFQQGNRDEAVQFLATARDRLDQVLRSGDLGEQWVNIAAALIAGDKASTAIMGKPMSPTVDADNLAHARESWQPVKELLEQADWAARRQEWEQALEGYRAAMAHPEFTWDAAVVQDQWLNHKLPALLVLTGHTNEYKQFCRDKVQTGQALYLLRAFPGGVTAQKALRNVRGTLEEIPDDQKLAERRHWQELTLGMAEYRNG